MDMWYKSKSSRDSR